MPKLVYGAVILSLLLAVGVGVDEWHLRNQMSSLQAENSTLEKNITQLETQDQVGAVYASKRILDKAQAARVQWSSVATDVLSQEAATEDIKFKQVTVNPEGEVIINGEATNLKSVAVLIQKLRLAEGFQGPFVPAISGETGKFGFQIQFKYTNI